MTRVFSEGKAMPDSTREKNILPNGGLFTELKRYYPLAPCVLGVVFARGALIISNYSSYTQTDAGILTDGSMLCALAFFAVCLLFVAVFKIRLSKRALARMMRVCIAMEAASILAVSAMDYFALGTDEIRFIIAVVTTVFASLCIFYWLRRVRGSGTIVAGIFVFSALFISEIEVFFGAMVTGGLGTFIAGLLVLLQYPLMLWARKETQPYLIDPVRNETDYFDFAKTSVSNVGFLSIMAVGIGGMSIVIGLLRGYPDGTPISFAFETRLMYMVLTMILCLAILLLLVKAKPQIMTVNIWVIMQLLACAAIVCYAAFPERLDIGAAFTTTLNAMMVAFAWYIIIAFMSFGWRDPLYYAISGWLVWLGARSLARIFLLNVYPLAGNDVLISSIIAMGLMVSAQAVFVGFIKLKDDRSTEGQDPKHSAMTKLMGLDGNESFSDVRSATMRHNAEEIGKLFMLSDREIEVLSLYALGHTQKRVAQELFVTTDTVHAHIKNLYAKTGFHSRQEIIDFMEEYAS